MSFELCFPGSRYFNKHNLCRQFDNLIRSQILKLKLILSICINFISYSKCTNRRLHFKPVVHLWCQAFLLIVCLFQQCFPLFDDNVWFPSNPRILVDSPKKLSQLDSMNFKENKVILNKRDISWKWTNKYKPKQQWGVL